MALLNSAMPYSLIQTEFRNCLSLLSDLYACTWALSQLFQSSEFTSHHTSHRDSSKLSCQSSTTLGKKKHRFSAAVSGTNQGAEGNNLLFKWLFFENFRGARTQFNHASMDSSSRRRCSPKSHCW